MAVADYSPEYRKDVFVCPQCGTQATQYWTDVWIGHLFDDGDGKDDRRVMRQDFAECDCSACDKKSLWHQAESGSIMLWPPAKQGPMPSDDMPSVVRDLYEEARSVEHVSPRSAAALLRTATELLLREFLADEAARLDSAIGRLVSEGKLDKQTQQAADLLRLTGNDAVHPSQLQIAGDDAKVGLSLFQLLNILVHRLITVPAQLQTMFDGLPEGKRQHVMDRDRSPTSP